jgi:hypothetical protein
VPGYPADIGSAPIDFAFAVIEDVFVSHRGVDEITAGRVQHTFWLSGRTRGVKDKQRVLGRYLLGRAIGRGCLAGLVIPGVAAFYPIDRSAGVADDDDFAHFGAMAQSVVGVALEWYRSAAAPAFVGGNQYGRATILNAAGKAVG